MRSAESIPLSLNEGNKFFGPVTVAELTSATFIRDVQRAEPKEKAVSISQLAHMFDLIRSEYIKIFCLMITNTLAKELWKRSLTLGEWWAIQDLNL